MSGLFASLNSSVNALSAQSRAVEITGKNLANVNNAKYARQQVVFGDRGTVQTALGPESMGLTALGVEQIRDSLLDQQVMREVALSAGYQTEQQAYQRAQAGLGQSIDSSSAAGSASSTTSNGIGAALDDFFNSFQSFAANPTDIGQRQTLVQSASILTDRLRLTDTRLAQVQSDLTSQVGTDVATTNQLLQTIADLNGQIGRFEITQPGSAVDLRDQRQAALEQLAAKLPIEIRNANAAQIQVVAKDGTGTDVVLVNLATVQGTVAASGTQITAGSPATVLDLPSGSIQGAMNARDGGIQSLRDHLDALASQLVTSVNAAYNPSGTTGDFFDPAGPTAGTIALAGTVTASNLKASDGGTAGDNTVALAIAQLASTQFSLAGGDAFDGTFSGFFATTVSDLGQSLAGANSRVDDQSHIEEIVRTQRDGISGVSLDEEMANLMKYQRAFQASSRVFTTVDNLLDTVINGLGH
jgi:flagellar hook-associated protein 1 FlgK